MPKFKHVATFTTKEGADYYKELNEKLGYEIKVFKRQWGNSSTEYVVYQSREKTK